MPARCRCPRCGGVKTWRLTRGGRRCARCRYEWRPGRWPLRLTAAEWRRLLQWFVRGASSAAIAKEARLNRKRVLRALTIVRERLAQTAPAPIRVLRDAARPGTSDREVGAASARSRRAAMLGLYAANGLVWAEVVPAADAAVLRQRLVAHRTGRLVIFPAQRRYAAVVDRGRLHRLRHGTHGEIGSASFGLVESFWAHAQRLLRAKGGIRLARLDLYLAECAWRYNHRRDPAADQLRQLLALVRHVTRTNGTLPRIEASVRPGDLPGATPRRLQKIGDELR